MTSSRFVLAALLFVPLAACGDSATGTGTDAAVGGDAGIQPDAKPTAAAPTIRSTSPTDGATAVPINGSITVTFSEAMDPATLTTSSFTVHTGAADLAGTVIYAGTIATFWPAVHLAGDASFTATITTAARSAAGVALAAPHSWTFAAGKLAAPGLAVTLGTAADFVVLAKSGVSTVPPAVITGNVGVSPVAASYITGFSLTAAATNDFAISTQVTGKVFAADYASPTPAKLTTAISDMELAFVDASGRAPDVTELGAGNVGGMTLAAGVYKWGTGLLIPTNLTLNGDATAVWIFQVAQDLTLSSATRIVLAGGALPENVFWQVAGRVELGTTAHLEGVVLTKTSITLGTGASAAGRLLAQTAIALDASTVVQPAH